MQFTSGFICIYRKRKYSQSYLEESNMNLRWQNEGYGGDSELFFVNMNIWWNAEEEGSCPQIIIFISPCGFKEPLMAWGILFSSPCWIQGTPWEFKWLSIVILADSWTPVSFLVDLRILDFLLCGFKAQFSAGCGTSNWIRATSWIQGLPW